jgi:hypothetical protein
LAPAKKQAAKKSPGAALVRWDEKFAKFASDAVDKEKNLGGGPTLKFSPGAITYNGANMPGGRFQGIILDSAFLNAWYKATYDQDSPSSPDCFAVGLTDDGLAPHEKSVDPQSGECASCEKNAFGSAETGRGKACGNKRRLAVLSAADCEDGADVPGAEMAQAIVSPTNLKAWAGYVRSLADSQGRPPWSVVTEIANVLDPGQTPSFHIEFSLVSLIDDDEILTALEKRLATAQEMLLRPFEPTPETPAKPSKRAGAPQVGKSARFAAPAVKKSVPAKKAASRR